MSVDEIRTLARGFLTGSGDLARIEIMSQVLEEDPQLGLELLTQMQSALDETAPAHLEPDQWSELETKVSALFAPGAGKKKSGFSLLGFIKGLFGKKDAGGATRVKRRSHAELSEEDDVLPMPDLSPEAAAKVEKSAVAAMVAEDEEVAPIAPSAPGVAQVDTSDEMAPIAAEKNEMPAHAQADAMEKREGGGAEAQPVSAPTKKGWVLAVLLLFGLAGAGAWWFMNRPAPPPPKVAVKPRPTPMPTVVPSPSIPSRGIAGQLENSDTQWLPSQLPEVTPQPAGWTEVMTGTEAISPDGGKKTLPLPAR